MGVVYTFALLQVYFSAHSTGEGKYCSSEHLHKLAQANDPHGPNPAKAKELVQLVDGEHPVIYAACGRYSFCMY
jgi:hypothetical protein